MTSDLTHADRVKELVAQLNGAHADDAWHSLVEVGAPAVPHLAKLFEATKDRVTCVSIMTVAGQQRSGEALELLRRGLASECDEVWKAALDGLVSFGGIEASQALAHARQSASAVKAAWLDEAASQVEDDTAP